MDLKKDKYGRWTLLSESAKTRSNHKRYLCRCECGVVRTVRMIHLKSGASKSCGCLKREICAESGRRNRIHGNAGERATLTYKSWRAMTQRCCNPKNAGYSIYGAKGISVCDRWKTSFQNFLADMGERPTASHSIDRINPRGQYDPANCRWATPLQQQRNRTNNTFVTIDGVRKCVTEWVEAPGSVSKSAFRRRIQSGWEPKRALFEPILSSSVEEDAR